MYRLRRYDIPVYIKPLISGPCIDHPVKFNFQEQREKPVSLPVKESNPQILLPIRATSSVSGPTAMKKTKHEIFEIYMLPRK